MKKIISLIVLILLISAFAIAKKVEDLEDKQFTKEEKDKLKNYEEIKDNFQNIEFTKYKEHGKIRIIYADVDNNELKIITTDNQFEKMKK